MHKLAAGAEQECATPSESRELRFFNLAPAVGLEPQSQPFGSSDTSPTESLHNRANSLQDSQLRDPEEGSAGHIRAFPEHGKDTIMHKKCALCVPKGKLLPSSENCKLLLENNLQRLQGNGGGGIRTPVP